MQSNLKIPKELHDFTGEDEAVIEGARLGSGPSSPHQEKQAPRFASLPTAGYATSLDAAKGNLSSQLEKIQSRMQELQQRRGEVEERRGEEAQRARERAVVSSLLDMQSKIGGQQATARERADAQAAQEQERTDRDFFMLEQELQGLEGLEEQASAAAVELMSQEETAQGKQKALQELNDPNSDMSKQARLTAELVLGQGFLPPEITAAQLEKVYPDIVKQAAESQKMTQQMKLEERKLLLDRQKEDRAFQKQLDLQERREIPTLSSNLARRGADVARSYIGAKDALEMVRSGAQAPRKSKATDETLLQGYQRLLQNQAMTYDEDGTPIVNKTLMDQANSKIRGWTEVMKGNQGILPEADRRALLGEAQNLYKIEQGFNVRRLQDMNDWVERNQPKNPTIDFSFVAPGVDPEILRQEAEELFPKGAGREVYSTTEELGGSTPEGQRQSFVPGQKQSGDTPPVTSAGRRVFRPGG